MSATTVGGRWMWDIGPEPGEVGPAEDALSTAKRPDDEDEFADRPEVERPWTLVTSNELDAPIPHADWLAGGLWLKGSHGVVAGPKKSLKTYTLQAIALGLAAGVPILGQFPVPEARPVVVFVGEGGLIPWRRRLKRMAEAYGVKLSGLPLYAVPHAGPLDGPEFREMVERVKGDIQPGLIQLDALYNYHPPGIEVSNAYDRGAMFAGLSELIGTDTALMIADHFNKNHSAGLAFDLDQIGQAGIGLWADSWAGTNHARTPTSTDVENGEFHLDLTVGSRQWGQRVWRVDWTIGTFNDDTGEHDGALSWAVSRSNGGSAVAGAKASGKEFELDQRKTRIVKEIADNPWTYTKSQLRLAVGGRAEDMNVLIDELVAERLIAVEERPRAEADRIVKRRLYGTPANPARFGRSVGDAPTSPLSPAGAS